MGSMSVVTPSTMINAFFANILWKEIHGTLPKKFHLISYETIKNYPQGNEFSEI
jgi:hypothetical protein